MEINRIFEYCIEPVLFLHLQITKNNNNKNEFFTNNQK